MTDQGPNKEQEDFWSNAGGLTWSSNDTVLDATLAPVLDHLLEVAALQAGEKVLDVGCGTGSSTIRAARSVAPGGAAVGLDIADQMLVRARELAIAEGVGNLEFVRADAQTHDFQTGQYDAVISRFGVMFFSDPALAFGNIACAVRPGGRMVFMTWASLPENPWFSIPRAAAIARLGPIEPMPPHAPGPMGLADRDYTRNIFEQAGLCDVSITPVALALTPPGTARDMAEFAMRLGPAVRIVAEQEGDAEDVSAIVAAITDQLSEFEMDAGLMIPAALNRIEVCIP